MRHTVETTEVAPVSYCQSEVVYWAAVVVFEQFLIFKMIKIILVEIFYKYRLYLELLLLLFEDQ